MQTGSAAALLLHRKEVVPNRKQIEVPPKDPGLALCCGLVIQSLPPDCRRDIPNPFEETLSKTSLRFYHLQMKRITNQIPEASCSESVVLVLCARRLGKEPYIHDLI